jgi:tetratricopeptide (TPR) repeat protein
MDADAYINKGLSLYYLGNNDEAIECYDKALEINPQNADAYYKKGLSLYYLGNNDEAIECYDKALEINPPIRTCL